MLLYKNPAGRKAGAASERLLLRIICLVLFETQVAGRLSFLMYLVVCTT